MPIRRNIGGYITANPTAPTQQAATGVWGLVQQLQASAASIWPFVRDPDFDYVSLLLPGNGTNGAQNNTFLDSSTNNFTITRNGDTTQGAFSPYGDLWSNYFDGSGDFLSIPNNAAFQFGSGDFTIEAWIYLTAYSKLYGGIAYSSAIFSCAEETSRGPIWSIGGTASSYTSFGIDRYPVTGIGASYNFQLNTWYYVTQCRQGNNWYTFVNGILLNTTSNSEATPNSTGTAKVGRGYTSVYNYDFPGYISNLRVVKGTALYTSNFTPPTAPLTAVSGTSLLTCQSSLFRDASTNNFTITANGNTSTSNFVPFIPTAYDPAVNGGSGYFDGSGDGLSVAGASFAAAGNFTLETWFYPTSFASNSLGLAIGNESSGRQVFYTNTSGTILRDQYGVGSTAFSATVALNQWQHIAFVRSGTTLTCYLNGVASGTQTVSGTFGNANGFRIDPTNAYLSNTRYVNGTAVYTANFTPPTAPVTAITNTSLLLNFTNAGIVDASAKNDLVTVGNAQISTAQSKFGGSSMYFDGSGDYLIIPDSAEFDFGTGNFTIEAWVYHTISSGTSQAYFTHATGGFGFSRNNAGALVASQASVADITSGGSIPLNAWTHIAVCRTGTSLSIFINGTAASTVTNNTNFNGTTAPQVGAAGGSLLMNGYINDLRITKGVARYTANFTPPTAPFPLG